MQRRVPLTIGSDVPNRPVFPSDNDLDHVRSGLGTLRDEPTSAAAAVDELADVVEPALVATTGPRYFGFVVGGALDAATAADVLTAGWDQPAFNAVDVTGRGAWSRTSPADG